MQIEQEIKDGIEASLTPLPKPEPKPTIYDFGKLLAENEPTKTKRR